MEVKITGSPEEIADMIKSLHHQRDDTNESPVEPKVDINSYAEQQRINLATGLGANLGLDDRIEHF